MKPYDRFFICPFCWDRLTKENYISFTGSWLCKCKSLTVLNPKMRGHWKLNVVDSNSHVGKYTIEKIADVKLRIIGYPNYKNAIKEFEMVYNGEWHDVCKTYDLFSGLMSMLSFK